MSGLQLAAVLLLGRQLPGRVLQGGVELLTGGVEAAVRARERDPDRLDRAGADRDAVAQLAADALAVRAVIAGARRDLLVAGAGGAGLRAAEAGAGLARLGGAGRADEHRVVVRLRAGQRAAVGEDEPAVLIGGDVDQVVGRGGVALGGRPRVGAHQLGVDVDLDRDGLGRLRRVRERQAEQRGAAAVGHEIGAARRSPAVGGKA